MTVKIGDSIDDCIWLLRGGGVVEPDQLPAVNALLEDREVAADEARIERPFGDAKIWNHVRLKLVGLRPRRADWS